MNCRQFKKRLFGLSDLPNDFTALPEELAGHALNCADCRQEFAKLLELRQTLRSLQHLQPPQSILENYASDLHRKLNASVLKPAKQFPRPAPQFLQPHRLLFRPVMAVAALVIFAVGVWWFGIRPRPIPETQLLATDSIDFYLDSFTEASAQNPIAVVNGLEYDWVYYGNTNGAK